MNFTSYGTCTKHFADKMSYHLVGLLALYRLVYVMERFHHMITIPYTRNKPPSWYTTCTVCYLQYMQYRLKKEHVSVM